MAELALSEPERRLLQELNQRGVRYLVVGMSAALLQGARGLTEDIDLWFEDLSDLQIGDAVRAAGGIWASGRRSGTARRAWTTVPVAGASMRSGRARGRWTRRRWARWGSTR